MTPLIFEPSQHPISRAAIEPVAIKVVNRLRAANHVAYLVGGCVRDLMLGLPPKDFDVATSAHPRQVRELFGNSRLIGRRFRLVHVLFGPLTVEVATFRARGEEPSEDGDPLIRRDNTFGTAEQDAFRRDFTINALFYDLPTGRVIDYIGGVADLQARVIRMIGDPEIRTREDPVRMIRAVRMAAKLGCEIEPATLAAHGRHRLELKKASPPRVVEEIYRTFGVPGAAKALILMQRIGLIEVVLPILAAQLAAGGVPLEEAAVTRNLAALEKALAAGLHASHAMVLGALFVDPPAGHSRASAQRPRQELIFELKKLGFARRDTEAMRLLLDAFERFLHPSRRLIGLTRRPYFQEAHRFYTLMAPGYGVTPLDLRAILDAWSTPANSTPPHDGRTTGSRRRRRRHRRRLFGSAAITPAQPEPAARPTGTAEESARFSAAGQKTGSSG